MTTLELPPKAPRPGPLLEDEAERLSKKDLIRSEIDAIYMDFAELQAQRHTAQRTADRASTFGSDQEDELKAAEAQTWLEEEYPSLEVSMIHRFSDKGYLPWADDASALHFYAALPDRPFEEIDATTFYDTVTSWLRLQHIIQRRLGVLDGRRRALERELYGYTQDRLHLSEGEKRSSPRQREILRLLEETKQTSSRILEKKKSIDVLLRGATKFAGRHGYSVDSSPRTRRLVKNSPPRSERRAA